MKINVKINPQDVQKLREMTGAGVMDCQRALKDAKGDFDAALNILREKRIEKVEKRSGRTTGAGLVNSYVHAGRIGVLVDVRAETDFVVRSEPFQALVHDIAMHIAASSPENIDALLQQPYIKDASVTVGGYLNSIVQKFGEKIELARFERFEI